MLNNHLKNVLALASVALVSQAQFAEMTEVFLVARNLEGRVDRGQEGRPQDNYESMEEFQMAVEEAKAAAQEAKEAYQASGDDSGRRLR